MPIIGCIADDFTGGTDLANNLVKGGFSTIQTIGIPDHAPDHVDAVVVALKSRSIPVQEAVSQSIAALEWLISIGCEKFYFKYCSTFDSTPEGNIGPVAEALMDYLGEKSTIFCPAFPGAGRTVYKGHLFVGQELLNECGMEQHPLNPMTDSSIVRWLDTQTTGTVGLLDAETIEKGEQSAYAVIEDMADRGTRLVVTDTLWDRHLDTIALASRNMRLVTGGSGLAQGLAALYHDRASHNVSLPAADGNALVLAGSASKRTREQIEYASQHMPSKSITPQSLAENFSDVIEETVQWAIQHLGHPILIHSDTREHVIKEAQQRLGIKEAGALMEKALASIAKRLIQQDVRQLIVAGGETSGAVVNELQIDALTIGQEIDPGVPWTFTHTPYGPLFLALKSGNFGSPDMFTRAWEIIQ